MEKRQIFDKFESEYMKWCETGERPSACDRDSAFLLEVQRKRLAKKAVHMHCRIKDYEPDLIEFSSKGDKNIRKHYMNGHMIARTAEL